MATIDGKNLNPVIKRVGEDGGLQNRLFEQERLVQELDLSQADPIDSYEGK